jgi:hypothetical protein
LSSIAFASDFGDGLGGNVDAGFVGKLDGDGSVNRDGGMVVIGSVDDGKFFGADTVLGFVAVFGADSVLRSDVVGDGDVLGADVLSAALFDVCGFAVGGTSVEYRLVVTGALTFGFAEFNDGAEGNVALFAAGTVAVDVGEFAAGVVAGVVTGLVAEAGTFFADVAVPLAS